MDQPAADTDDEDPTRIVVVGSALGYGMSY